MVEHGTENPCVGSSSLSLNKMKHNLFSMFTHIRNGQIAKRPFIYQRKVKNCESFLDVMWNEGYILGYEYCADNKIIKIILKYTQDNRPAINSIKLITKPSRRIYYSLKQLWKLNQNSGLIILSTNKGVLSLTDCKRLGVGGEAFVIIN